ncbi:MAG: DNA repair exonuclease [Firmicutes bacterium]|nr:DNA repair exonuclease [Bacillota bacterium]
MGKGFSFIHAADLHLDSPFRGISQEVSETGEYRHIVERLRDCTFIALKRLVDLCLQERVDFLLLAGDVYDLSNRSLRAQLRFREETRRLAEMGIQVFIVTGNHDSSDGWRADLEFPETVHVFSDREVESRPVIRQGQEVARVYGISYPRAAVTENLALLFPRPPREPFSIAMLHANVGSIEGYDNYAPCRLDDLIGSGYDYWALGHIHSHTVLHTEFTRVIYPGCHQGRSVREMGAKGCVLVRVAEDRSLECEFMPTDNVRWHFIDLPIAGLGTDTALLNALEDRLWGLKQNNPRLAGVVRVQLNGRGPLHKRLMNNSYRTDLLQQLRSRYSTPVEDFVWIESLNLNVQPEIDKESVRQSQTLLGDFLRLSRQAALDPDLMRQLKAGMQALHQNHPLGRYLDEPSGEEMERLLAEAEDLGLDLLGGEDG